MVNFSIHPVLKHVVKESGTDISRELSQSGYATFLIIFRYHTLDYKKFSHNSLILNLPHRRMAVSWPRHVQSFAIEFISSNDMFPAISNLIERERGRLLSKYEHIFGIS